MILRVILYITGSLEMYRKTLKDIEITLRKCIGFGTFDEENILMLSHGKAILQLDIDDYEDFIEILEINNIEFIADEKPNDPTQIIIVIEEVL